MKLVAPTGYPKAQAIRLTAQIANVTLEYEPIEWKKVNSPEFLQRNPQGSVPILEINGEVISESNAILRHFARLAEKRGLYGEGHFDQAQVDSYLDFNSLELQPMAFALTSPIFGWVSFNQARYEQAKKDLVRLLQYVEDHLQMRTYLVGQKMTIADIAIVATLIPLFKFILEQEQRKQFANITRWFQHITSQPIFVQYFGKIHLCKKEWTLEGQTQVQQQQEQQQQQQKPAPKKAEKKKEAPKKAEKKKEAQPKKVEKKPEPVPEKPKGNPLDNLPASKFNLFDYKTQITNTKDRKDSVKFLVDNFDPEGFSVYYVEYERYEGEGVKLFLTSNFKDSFLQRLDHFRKYCYAVHGVYGKEGDYEVCGVWLWRGNGIPQEIKDLPNYDYHKWNKLDIQNKQEDRQLLEDFWCGLEEDKSVAKGRVARDITCFK